MTSKRNPRVESKNEAPRVTDGNGAYTHAQAALKMDAAFQRAMRDAIAAGLESEQ
jgi:LDH2 family malate/lactate/ureidoglycolate dehydrogenase